MKTFHSTKLGHILMVLTVLLGTFASLIGATTVKADDPTTAGADTVSFKIHKKETTNSTLIKNDGKINTDLEKLKGVAGAEFTVYNVTQMFYDQYENEAIPDGLDDAGKADAAKNAATAVETNLQNDPSEVEKQPVVNTQTTGDDGTADFTDLPAKTTISLNSSNTERDSVYAFAETKTPDDYATSTLLIVALPANTENGVINLYPKDARLSKTVYDAQPDGSYQAGDILQYQVTMPIPQETANLSTLSVGDAMTTPGATFKQIDSISINGKDLTKDQIEAFKTAGDFKAETDASKPESWNMDFDADDVSFLSPYRGMTATITYSVAVNEYAVPAATLDNEFGIDFGHNPHLKTNTNIVPNGGHKFTKIDSKTGEKLGNATFILRNSENQYAKMVFADGDDNKDGVYNPADIEWVDNKDDATALKTSDEDATKGSLQIEGLKFGAYTLVETIAPATYTLPGNPNTPFAVSGTETWGESTIQSIKNTKEPGTILPMTGGMGFILFALVGLALFGAGFIVMKRGKAA